MSRVARLNDPPHDDADPWLVARRPPPAGVILDRREAVVREHMRAEMAGDLDATLATFAADPEYDIVALRTLHSGAGPVRELLAHLLGAFPDLGLHARVVRHTADAVVIEGRMTGTHLGRYGPVNPSRRQIDLRAAILFHFDDDRLLRETVYYDELTLLDQIGLNPIELDQLGRQADRYAQ